ncbi:MAG: SAM-dependent methyltransferase [Rhodospirillales bacterium]
MWKKLIALPLLLSGIFTLSFIAAVPAAGVQDDTPALDVPYVPTTHELVEEMLKLGGVKPGDVVYDLGCGDGRIVIMAAQKFGARGVGVDLNPERIREATENARKAGVTDRVRFINGNLFDADIRNATVVTLYLLPDVNLKLRPKLLKDLKPGTRIVSHSFDMGDWKPDKEVEVNGSRLFLWTVPKK